MAETYDFSNKPEQPGQPMDALNAPQQPNSTKPYVLAPNIEAAACYLIPIWVSLVVLYFEKTNKFVKFHALQALLFWVAFCLVMLFSNPIFSLLGPVGAIIRRLLFYGLWITWAYLSWNAFNYIEFELPWLGKFVRTKV